MHPSKTAHEVVNLHHLIWFYTREKLLTIFDRCVLKYVRSIDGQMGFQMISDEECVIVPSPFIKSCPNSKKCNYSHNNSCNFSKILNRPCEMLSTIVARVVLCDLFKVFDISFCNFFILDAQIYAALNREGVSRNYFF